MTDFGYFGMVIGIVVIVGWIFASVFRQSAKDVAGLVGYYSNKSKLKEGGYYDLPESPPGFFEKYQKKYYTEILCKDFHRVPYGIYRRVIERNIEFTFKKKVTKTAQITSCCLASLKEIEKGYRPTFVPAGYLTDTTDIWECIRQSFPEEYDEEYNYMYTRGHAQLAIDAQKAEEARYNKKYNIDPTKEEVD